MFDLRSLNSCSAKSNNRYYWLNLVLLKMKADECVITFPSPSSSSSLPVDLCTIDDAASTLGPNHTSFLSILAIALSWVSGQLFTTLDALRDYPSRGIAPCWCDCGRSCCCCCWLRLATRYSDTDELEVELFSWWADELVVWFSATTRSTFRRSRRMYMAVSRKNTPPMISMKLVEKSAY